MTVQHRTATFLFLISFLHFQLYKAHKKIVSFSPHFHLYTSDLSRVDTADLLDLREIDVCCCRAVVLFFFIITLEPRVE